MSEGLVRVSYGAPGISVHTTGWSRLVGSLKLYVSFRKEPY